MDAAGPLIAAIAQKGVRFVADVKMRGDIVLFEMTQDNRDVLVRELVECVKRMWELLSSGALACRASSSLSRGFLHAAEIFPDLQLLLLRLIRREYAEVHLADVLVT